MTPSKPDMGAAMELARDTVKFSDTMFPDKAMDTGTTNLARAYLALQQTVDAGIVGMPEPWVLSHVAVYFVNPNERNPCYPDSPLEVKGSGNSYEAAVRDAANKVAK